MQLVRTERWPEETSSGTARVFDLRETEWTPSFDSRSSSGRSQAAVLLKSQVALTTSMWNHHFGSLAPQNEELQMPPFIRTAGGTGPALRYYGRDYVNINDWIEQAPVSNWNCLVYGEGNCSPVIISSTEGYSQKLAEIIGQNGISRIESFKRYQEGWNFGVGNPLSLASLGALEYFISQYNSFECEPSVFLSDNGNLILGWESVTRGSIELEFWQEKIEYFVEDLNVEGTIGINSYNIKLFIELITQHY
jgi:hypothetical protein